MLFSVNPAGVQADAAWTRPTVPITATTRSGTPKAEITKEGWMALIAIPFRSLRFRAQGSDWGVVFWAQLPAQQRDGPLAARFRQCFRHVEPGGDAARH